VQASRSFPAALRGNLALEGFGRGHRKSHVLRGRPRAIRSQGRLRTTVSPVVPHFRRGTAGRLTAVVALLLLATLGGALAAVVVASANDATTASEVAGTRQVAASPVTVTERVVKTVMQAPETVTNLVTTTVQAAPVGPPQAQTRVSIDDAIALTDQSTQALGRGDWHEAVRLARLAYPALVGTYSASNPYEAYVNFDLGDALAGQGRCILALRYLARSEALQGPRDPITTAKGRCGR
jgi:hypothetical protein